jgi:ATP-dependent DNA helicase RecQ
MENCGGCDSCLSPRERINATEISYKIMSAVVRLGERFGVNHVIDVLQGKKNKKVVELGHERLPVFGIEKNYHKDELRHFIQCLIGQNYLMKTTGEYPILQMTEVGKDALKYREHIFLAKPRMVQETLKKKVEGDLIFDAVLFEQLRTLRKELADEKNVPPFVIFSDVSLREMAHYFPQSLESFQHITGVGAMKLTQYGELFLGVIRKYAEEHGKKEIPIPQRNSAKMSLGKKPSERVAQSKKVKVGGATFQQTKDLLSEKLSIVDMAKKRGLSEGTILSHLEKFVEAGESIDITYLAMPAERFAKIRDAFQKSGGLILTPVLKILGSDYSYEELRLARVFLQLESRSMS